MNSAERMRINEHWRLKYRQSFNRCRQRLCSLPVGAEIDAETWYGGGWDTANRVLRELADIDKPLFKIVGSPRADSIRAVKIR